jgi:hypothetical protein
MSVFQRQASKSRHADLFSKSRITLLWLESRRSSLQFGSGQPLL